MDTQCCNEDYFIECKLLLSGKTFKIDKIRAGTV